MRKSNSKWIIELTGNIPVKFHVAVNAKDYTTALKRAQDSFVEEARKGISDSTMIDRETPFTLTKVDSKARIESVRRSGCRAYGQFK